jgi:circadian clock protein KaiC
MTAAAFMPPPMTDPVPAPPFVRKSPTGVSGLDEITDGGLPTGRPTLIAGGPGSGKTLLGISFLVNGIRQFGEPGVLMTFEENALELAQDVASLGVDLQALVDAGQLVIDYVRVERSEIEETGEYDLEGLFVRLDHSIRTVGARRVMLDTLESLFSGLPNETILRAELRRLLRWLRDRGMTVVITGERGERTLTRHGLEEYVTDAVIQLDHRVHDQISTRRLRVVKYRGSAHGTNEYPFLIDTSGINVLPVTSLALQHQVSPARVSSGLPALDEMLGGKGYYRGNTVLVTGTAGTGKTTVAATFAAAACARGEKCLYFLFEESPLQLRRNMQSVGIDLDACIDGGRIVLHAERPSRHGLETHLVLMHRAIEAFDPDVVVVDPMTNLLTVGTAADVRTMLTRLIDFLKGRGITALFTSLAPAGQSPDGEGTISSLMDAWVVMSADVEGRRRRRWINVLKARGVPHSDDVREFRFTDHGMQLLPAAAGDAR